jgi:hypothetical protein
MSQMANEKLDELHRSMGEFLTACAHLENMLWALLIICQDGKKSLQEITQEFLPLTLGQRVDLADRLGRAHNFSAPQAKLLAGAFDQLKEMVKKRNLIVHGTTYEIGFSGENVVPRRIGVPRGNLEYMQQFIQNRGDVLHSFTAEQVKEAAVLCDELRGAIGKVVTKVMMERTQKR